MSIILSNMLLDDNFLDPFFSPFKTKSLLLGSDTPASCSRNRPGSGRTVLRRPRSDVFTLARRNYDDAWTHLQVNVDRQPLDYQCPCAPRDKGWLYRQSRWQRYRSEGQIHTRISRRWRYSFTLQQNGKHLISSIRLTRLCWSGSYWSQLWRW